MSEDHYFTATPASPAERRTVSVTLDGRAYDLEAAAGVFSPGRVDLGTTVLLDAVGTPPAGDLLDLGCGWGPIALTAALRQPDARVTAVDVNERALDLLARNATIVGRAAPIAPVIGVLPDAVGEALRFDAIWSNPPIRIGKAALHELLARWLPRLKPGAQAHLVVQRHLGADSLARWIGEQGWGDVDRVGSSKGYRVLRLTRAAD